MRTPERVIASLCGLTFSWLFLPTGVRASLGSFNVDAGDLLALAMFAVTGRRLWRRGYLRPPAWWTLALSVYAALYFVSLARGVAEGIPIQTIANTLRLSTLILATLAYFTFVAPGRLDHGRTFGTVFAAAAVFASVAVLRLVGVLPIVEALSSFGDEIPRPIGSDSTMFMASAFFLSWFMLQTGRLGRWKRWAFPLLLPLVILMQHRSVWTAVLAMTALTLAFERAGRKRALVGVALVALGLAALVTVGSSTLVAKALSSSADRALGQKDTVAWRYESWHSALDPSFMKSNLNYAIGRPAGESMARLIGRHIEEVPVHNNFVELIVGSGVVGLCCIVAMIVPLSYQLLRSNTAYRGWAVVILGQLVYWISYDQTPGLMLIVALAYASLRQRQEALAYEREALSLPPHRPAPSNGLQTA